MYTVEAEPGARKPDGTPSTRPTCARCRTGSCGRSCARCPASPRSTRSAATSARSTSRPIPARLLAFGLTLARRGRRARSATTQNVGAGYIERNGQQYLVRVPGQVGRPRRASATSCSTRRDGVPIRVARRRRGRRGRGAAHRRRDAERRGGRARHGVHADGREQPRSVAQAAAAKLEEIQPEPARRA